MNTQENFFVITGGPGSGKTSLVEAFKQRGYSRSVEAGRAIIQDQILIGGRALPWEDRTLFAELMLSWEIRSYHIACEDQGPVFFDRGVPDVLGYLRLSGIAAPSHMEKAARMFRYNRRVFIAPPWDGIFEQDRERKQDFTEAVRTYDVMLAIYAELGYQLIEIPRVSIGERLDFVLDQIKKTS